SPAVPPSCPVPRYEPCGLRYAWYEVLAHLAPGGLWVVDRERGYDCMHACVLSTAGRGDSPRCCAETSLTQYLAKAAAVHAKPRLLSRAATQIPDHINPGLLGPQRLVRGCWSATRLSSCCLRRRRVRSGYRARRPRTGGAEEVGRP